LFISSEGKSSTSRLYLILERSRSNNSFKTGCLSTGNALISNGLNTTRMSMSAGSGFTVEYEPSTQISALNP